MDEEAPAIPATFKLVVKDDSPLHYLLKIESFSKFFRDFFKEKRFESRVFEAEGHKWKLVMCLNDFQERDPCLSLYLMIVETRKYPKGWTVNANFSLSMYDHVRDKYYTYTDRNLDAKSFNAATTMQGFHEVISIKEFYNPLNGYLRGDACLFGASFGRFCFPETNFTWKIKNFSDKKNEEMIESPKFQRRGYDWSLLLYPKGHPSQVPYQDHLSIFLKLSDDHKDGGPKLSSVRFTLLVKNQMNGNDLSNKIGGFIELSHLLVGYGWHKLLPLDRLESPTDGLLVNDLLIIEAKVEGVSQFETYLS